VDTPADPPTRPPLRLGEAAAVYAAAGLAVFPCLPGGKPPLSEHGFTDASSAPDQVAAWWARWPRANIGLPTAGGGFDVLDVDIRPSGSGFTALGRRAAPGGWAYQVRTPSGGRHLYFPAHPETPQPSWTLPGVHLDFRGTGGYVIVPPSHGTDSHGERRGYELTAVGQSPGPLDAAAVRDLSAPDRAPREPVTVQRPLDAAGGKRLARWLAAQAEGNRNAALFWAACRHAEAGIGPEQAHRVLAAAASSAGLGEREIRTTISSAYRSAAHRSETQQAAVDQRLGP
jgi:hypothetical protein